MSATTDHDRLLRAWLDVMPDEAPDRVVSAVLQATETTRQVRALPRIGPWRSPMNRISLIAAVAVIAAALIGGALVMTSGGTPVLTMPTVRATTSPTSTATSTVAPSRPNPAAGYKDLQGWIVFEHFGKPPVGSTAAFDPEYRMIWLVHADGSGLHELAPNDPPAGKASPDISPDGTKVAFESWTGSSAIYEVAIEGGSAAPVPMNCPSGTTCDGLDPAYSADGTSVAFVRVEFRGAVVSTVIAVTDLETGKTAAIESTRFADAKGYLAQPSWSPTGREIVYYRVTKTPTQDHPADTRLFVAATDDSSTRELPRPTDAWAADPDWSPDGSLIVFSTAPNRETEGWGFPNFHGIYTIRPDGSQLTQICTTCLQGGWAPTWTPDGKHILFWGFRSWALMDADGKNAAHINQSKLTWFGETLGYGYAAFLQPGS
jgi:dipeptidyl aminopeptidase/acylaminoacyl peptidase